MKKKRNILIGVLIILLIGGLGILILKDNFYEAPYITNVEFTESAQFDNQVIINVEVGNAVFKINKATWCLLADVSEDDSEVDVNSSDWVKAQNGYCNFTVDNGDYTIYVKDSYGNTASIDNQKYQINKVLEIKTNKSVLYMYLGMDSDITYELSTIGEASEVITFSSSNESVATVNNEGQVEATGYGKAVITLAAETGRKALVNVVVSPLITEPKVDTSKNYISCKQFSSEEAELIDNILFDRIDEAGYQTRAGVVAAARFITLEFAYRIHYFYENGRLNNYAPYYKVDGEGRYYHRGMYLNESKFSELQVSLVGPAIWGCDLQNYTDWGPYVTGNYYPNGLDCSGFVTWALLNGGYDVGDIGAGIDDDHLDLTDLGERVTITNELMASGKVKAGDLIGLNGHAAILAGWDDENYYIAESLNTTGGVVMTVVKKTDLVNNSIYKYVILMDEYYKDDGNYTEMW